MVRPDANAGPRREVGLAVASDRRSCFVRDVGAAFASAALATGVIEHDLLVADRTIRLRFAGPTLVPYLLPALAHLVINQVPQPDLTICLWDTASAGSFPPFPYWSVAEYRLGGRLFGDDDGMVALSHSVTAATLSVLDRSTRTAFFWTGEAKALSIHEQSAPLQTILHWAMSTSGWQIVHAAVVGAESGGVLLVGNPGAGKSTTALAAAGSALRYLSDDKCLVRLTPQPQAFGLYNSGKLNADSLEQLPHLRPFIVGRDDNNQKGKCLLFLHPACANWLMRSCPLRAVLIPQVGAHAGPAVRPVLSSAALRVLGPSTLLWLPGAERTGMAFMAALVRSLPCYDLYLSPKLADNCSALAEVIRTHA